MNIRRMSGVIPPMLTPFTSTGELDENKHLLNMERWNQSDLAGYLVLGSNSEAVYLKEAEKHRLIQLTVRHALPGRVILAGTGMESTRETITLTNEAADLGAHGALILTPFYYGSKMNEDALIQYYTTVADHARIPILIYHVSKFTHISLSVRTVKVLSRHPNIVGMKDSSGDIGQLVRFSQVIPPDFNLMVGTASIWYPALTLGIKAGIMALANVAPGQCIAIQDLYRKGNHEEAARLYVKMFPVNDAVTAMYGVAGLKFAATLLGYQGGAVRSPLLPVDEREQAAIRGILIGSGLLQG